MAKWRGIRLLYVTPGRSSLMGSSAVRNPSRHGSNVARSFPLNRTRGANDAEEWARSLVTASVPSLRQLTLPSSFLLLGAAAAWTGVVVVARHMGPMPGTMGLGIGTFVAVWTLMMAAMMLPSVTPFASFYARTLSDNRTTRLLGLAIGYLLVWSVASIPAYGLAWLADRAIAGHPGVCVALAAIIFGACGIYQLTPLKDRCLARCRSPLGFILKFGSYKGRTRDLRVGLHHGGLCLACCWGLMALLVAFGLMNLIAMVVLTAVVLVEKTGPSGRRFSRALGIASLVLAVVVIFQPHLAPGLQPAGSGGQMGRIMSTASPLTADGGSRNAFRVP